MFSSCNVYYNVRYVFCLHDRCLLAWNGLWDLISLHFTKALTFKQYNQSDLNVHLYVSASFAYDDILCFKVQHLNYSSLFYFLLAVWEKLTLTSRQKKYCERKKLSGSNFLQKERTRQKKYQNPKNTLTKAQLKERREAVKQRVYASRNRGKLQLK